MPSALGEAGGIKRNALSAYDTLVLCDFDGTVALQDAFEVLLQRYGGPGHVLLLDAFSRGELDSATFMQRSLATLGAPVPLLARVFDEIEIDPTFPEFVRHCQEAGWEVCIVSDGLDWWINPILARYQQAHLNRVCNQVTFTEDGPRFRFPWRDFSCPICAGRFAMCKRAAVEAVRDQHTRVLFVGDGKSDRCAVRAVDRVFAKSELAAYCRREGIAYWPFGDFSDVMRTEKASGEWVADEA